MKPINYFSQKYLASAVSILESISDGVFTVDHDWRITSFNRAAEEIVGMSREEALGRICSDVFRCSMCEEACALRHTMESGEPVINRVGFIINARGQRRPIAVSTAMLLDEGGEIIGGAETFRDLSELENLKDQLTERFKLGDFVSRSPAMRNIFDILPAVASTSSNILIQGETGTGKEVLAKTIHTMGPRAPHPFVAVNCAALPDALLESELFGYKKGAFTGADRDREGRFALAGRGTIFLDEIGEMSMSLQVKLLRVLQEKSYEPLGSSRPVPCEARILAATNRDLFEMVQKGTFRQDLFYRINVITLELPPLRNRREDIPFLTEHFLEQITQRQGRNITRVSPEVYSLFMAHEWPGNIRELENIIERAIVLCMNSEVICTEHLPASMTGLMGFPSSQPLQMSGLMERTEQQVILSALRRNNYNRTAAAMDLGVHKTTLYRKIKALGIELPGKDGRSTP